MIICLGPTPAIARTMSFAKINLDAVNRALSVHAYPAGKAINVARVLHTLGKPTLATGFVGGEAGQFIQSELTRVNIAHNFLTVEPTTRLAITAIDESVGTATELIEEPHPLREADYVALLAKLSSLLKKVNMLVLSGRLPPAADHDFYAQCVQIAEPTVRVIVDTVGDALLATLPHRPFVIKPNRSEIADALKIEIKNEEDLRHAMRGLAARGAQWVIVTRGRESTLVTNGQSFWKITSPQIKVVSPIGSGDSFAAGLAASLRDGQQMPDACILAAACGGANAMTAFAGHVQMKDVDSLVKQIRVEPIA
jgi:tagatose 6-phosphate kinase